MAVQLSRGADDAAPTQPMILVEDVWRAYGSNGSTVSALEAINLEVARGEFCCLVGPSGCGKSTLLELIANLQRPDRGCITLGEQCDRAPVLMSQEAALFPWLTVLGNVEFGLKVARVPRAERRRIALEQLALVRLSRFAHAQPHELSGGMRQRAALARSLAVDPPVLLMDEPFAALDAQSRDIMHQELQRIWQETGKTIVFVTHNVREAACLADRVVLMTARPARVKEVIAVDLPRPRSASDPSLAQYTLPALEHLREEIEKVEAKEFDNGWHSAQGGVHPVAPGGLAGGR